MAGPCTPSPERRRKHLPSRPVPAPHLTLQPLERAAFSYPKTGAQHPLPILRSGYATRRRNGSTRAHRTARAQTLAEETLCWICLKPGRDDDPLTADHVIAHAAGGPDTRTNYRAAHESCNKRRGSSPLRGGGV